MSIILIALIISGCAEQYDQDNAKNSTKTNPNYNNYGPESQAPTTEIKPVAEGFTAGWALIERPNEGFNIKFPHGWYWQRDTAMEKRLGYDFFIGFSPTQEKLDNHEYYIEFMVAADFNSFRKGIVYKIIENKGRKYVFTGDPLVGGTGMTEIVNAMADSFQALDKELIVVPFNRSNYYPEPSLEELERIVEQQGGF